MTVGESLLHVADAGSLVERKELQALSLTIIEGPNDDLSAPECFTRLVASSVAAMATRPMSVSEKPCCVAAWHARRRASATRERSATDTNIKTPNDLRRFPTH